MGLTYVPFRTVAAEGVVGLGAPNLLIGPVRQLSGAARSAATGEEASLVDGFWHGKRPRGP